MRKKRVYDAKKPEQITKSERAKASLYGEALKVLPTLISKWRALGKIKVAAPLTDGQADYIRKRLRYERRDKTPTGNGTLSVV